MAIGLFLSRALEVKTLHSASLDLFLIKRPNKNQNKELTFSGFTPVF